MQQRYLYIFEMLREEIKKPDSVQWFDWKQMKLDVEAMFGQGFAHEVHEQMTEFYGSYIMGNIEPRTSLWSFIDFVAHRDDEIGDWATDNINLMVLTHRWIELENSRALKDILARLGQTGYRANWQELRLAMDERLRRMEVDGTRNGMKETGYFYCLLHAFTMIMMADVEVETKMRLLDQFSGRWSFLRYMYSVMTRSIIGFAFTNFASVTNNLTNDKEYEPYYHLYHSPLKERFEELCDKGTKKDKLQRALSKLEQRMKQADRSNDLDILCEVLFPDEFRDILNRHRPKSYKELEGEVCRIKQEMQGTIQVLNEQINALATQLSAAVKASVPIIEIEQELLRFPSQQALPIFMQLNTLLMGNEAWNLSSLAIRDKILAKQQQELQLIMNITAQQGSYVNGMVQTQTNHGVELNKQIPAA